MVRMYAYGFSWLPPGKALQSVPYRGLCPALASRLIMSKYKSGPERHVELQLTPPDR